MTESTKTRVKLAIVLVAFFLLVWRPRFRWPNAVRPVVRVNLRLPRTLGRLKEGVYLKAKAGSALWRFRSNTGNPPVAWKESEGLGKLRIEGVVLRNGAFRELVVGYRNSHSHPVRIAASIELFTDGGKWLLLFWGSNKCSLEIPHDAKYVATKIPSGHRCLREFRIQPGK